MEIQSLVLTLGYIGLFLIVFFESGVFGFFLPGSSLLFTAGLLASGGYFSIVTLCIIFFIASVCGNMLGYAIGAKYGKRLFKEENSLLFHTKHLIKAQAFYEKHGGKTIVLARFIPVVRTFAPIAAGIGNMNYTSFLLYNFLGGLLWAIGVLLLGYYLGETIPDIESYLLPVIGSLLVIMILFSKAVSWHAKKNTT